MFLEKVMLSGKLYELGGVSYLSSRVVKSESYLWRELCKEGLSPRETEWCILIHRILWSNFGPK